MATYSPQSLGIKAPATGFQQGGWYGGRQYWNGTLSDPGVIHEQSNQVGAGQLVSKDVNLQSDAAQGNKPGDIEKYLEAQRQKQAQAGIPSGPSAFSGAGMGAAGSGSGAGMGLNLDQTQASLNLPDVYKNLYAQSGVSDLEKQLSSYEKDYIDAQAGINDNPFLAEATRLGRIAKLDDLYQKRTANIRGDIATKKADIETQLNLQMKQFDINSEVARQGLEKLNTLLSMGALSGASGEDIAQLTRMTGISSSMIKSAVNTAKQKDIKTQVLTSTNDAGVVTATVINADTGEIIKSTSLGAIGNAQQGRGATESEQKAYYMSTLRGDVESGLGVKDIMRLYTGYLDPNQIIQLYNANSPHGPARESAEELAKYGVSLPKTQDSAYAGF